MSQVKRTDFIERNNLKAFMAIARDWIFIFLIIALSMQVNNIFVYLAAVWLIGIFQYSIGDVLLHEAVHHNLFTDKSWHEKLEFIYAFPFLRTFSSYRQHHFAHHKYLLAE
ncbi:MAG TPA: fatty acid desaturase, partial [Allocoleopsis sp.]